MGCSASRFDTLLAKAIEDPSFCSSNTSSFSSSSSSSSSSCNTSSIFPKSRSFSAPLIHHPAINKGDSNHLVCLTSSSYGSLIVVDKCPSPATAGDVSGQTSPDSVINTWELMEGLEEDEEFKCSDIKLKCLGFDSVQKIPTKMGDFVDGFKNSSDFKDAQKIPTSRSCLNLSDSLVFDGAQKIPTKMGDFVDGLKNSGDSKGAQKLPTSRSCLNLSESNVFDGVQKRTPSKLGLHVDDFVNVLRNSSDFKDYQNLPSLRSVLESGDSVKKLSDSYVFVEMPGEIVEEGELNKGTNSKPLWKHLSEESLLSKMDPNVASSYRKALSSKKLGCDQPKMMTKSVSSVSSVTESKSFSSLASKSPSDNACELPDCKDKIVLYYTSLRGIRRTYEDCCAVRMIVRGFRVVVDERDISMDSNYRKELQSALDEKVVSLPQLFIRGKLIGGADEIKQLHENGELERLLDGFPIQNRGFSCERCGESRFVLCLYCNGSQKVFNEEEGRMRRCPKCNENGLVRCSWCC